MKSLNQYITKSNAVTEGNAINEASEKKKYCIISEAWGDDNGGVVLPDGKEYHSGVEFDKDKQQLVTADDAITAAIARYHAALENWGDGEKPSQRFISKLKKNIKAAFATDGPARAGMEYTFEGGEEVILEICTDDEPIDGEEFEEKSYEEFID